MRKMKIFAACLVCLAFAYSGGAQSTSPYIFIKPIYGFNSAAQLLDENTTLVNGDQFTKGIYGSYASGFSLAAGVGKMINSTLGVELSAQYFFGKTITINYDDAETDEYSDRVKALTLNPMLVLRSSGDLLAVYSKLGLAILVYSRKNQDNVYHDTSNGISEFDNTSAIEYVKPKVGFTAAFGLSFRVSESVSIFGEVNGMLMSLPIYKGHFTSYKENGTDILHTLDPVDKEWVYQKSGYLSLSNQPKDKPAVLLYSPPNFSYIGISVGLTYHF